ncbi:MAG: transposase, partial [Chloroflexi bacterium]|nr:transposase [Chloroflexota bacterium]
MSVQAKRELLAQTGPRYRAAPRQQKRAILDEFVAATGYARKYAIRLLGQPTVPRPVPITRPRARQYGSAVVEALTVAWAASNYVCAKRLVPFLPDLVASLERHGHLTLSAEVRTQLLTLSAATADRLLRPTRERARPRGIGTTKVGTLLKHKVPIRTFAEWDDVRPGFMEVDTVAHCGTRAEGPYLSSLVLTDVATGWTECLPLLHHGYDDVLRALDQARLLLPFPLRGLDTDNGREFLNYPLLEYCAQAEITFTRGRAYRKNDQCDVEQKNGSIVRQIVGYDRFEGELAYHQLAELYRALRLYVNVFQPSLKLVLKRRDGSRVYRRYDTA